MTVNVSGAKFAHRISDLFSLKVKQPDTTPNCSFFTNCHFSELKHKCVFPHQNGIFLADVVFPLIEDKISSLVVSIFLKLDRQRFGSNSFSENILVKLNVFYFI